MERLADVFTTDQFCEMLEILNSSERLTFIDEMYEKHGYIQWECKEKLIVKQLSIHWALKFDIKPKNLSWNEDYYDYIHLFMWAYGYNSNQSIPFTVKKDLISMFHHKFSWELLSECCRKAGYNILIE